MNVVKAIDQLEEMFARQYGIPANDEDYHVQLEDIRKELDRYDFSKKIIGCPGETAQSELVNYFTNYNKAKKVIYWQDFYDDEMTKQCDWIVAKPPFSDYDGYILYLKYKAEKGFFLIVPENFDPKYPAEWAGRMCEIDATNEITGKKCKCALVTNSLENTIIHRHKREE